MQFAIKLGGDQLRCDLIDDDVVLGKHLFNHLFGNAVSPRRLVEVPVALPLGQRGVLIDGNIGVPDDLATQLGNREVNHDDGGEEERGLDQHRWRGFVLLVGT